VDEGRPIFQQVAERLADDIVSGATPEETQVPSINELAAFYRINPATALKGINLLVDAEVLYKRRGVGMFVASGARERLVAQRRAEFAAEYVEPLVARASALGMTPDQLDTMIRKEYER
jgi:DNA-binding transcriptional regulator YhcF (GntR family)